MDDFKQNVKLWVSIDNEMQNLNTELKQLRAEKKRITCDMYSFANTNNYNSTINISDGSLKFNTCKTAKPISLSYVESCLHNCKEDICLSDDSIEHIMNIIKSSRDYSIYYDIKRVKKNDT